MAAMERNGGKRNAMPWVASVFDDLREAFGREDIDAVIRVGLKPDCPPDLRVFACEGGQVVGQRAPDPHPAKVVSVADMCLGPAPVVEKVKR